MKLRITGVVDFDHHPEFEIQGNTAFRKLEVFSPAGEGRDPAELISISIT
jgi:hypothetical protein